MTMSGARPARASSSTAVLPVHGRHRRASPSLQQFPHAFQHAVLIIDDHGEGAGERIDGRRSRGNRRFGSARASVPTGTSTKNTEPLPSCERTPIGWPSTREMRLTIASPRPKLLLLAAIAAVELPELLENLVDAVVRDADAGVPDLDPDPVAATAAAEQHPARRRVANGVGEKVAKHAAKQRRIGANHRGAGHDREVEAGLLARSADTPRPSADSRSPMTKSVFSAVMAPASSLEMSSSVSSSASTLPSARSMLARRTRAPFAQRPLGERGNEQPRRIQWLQQIVAGGGKEPRLAQIGLLRLRLRQTQRLLDLRRARRSPAAACALSAVSSAVRSATRRSRLSFASCSCSAAMLAVGDIGVGGNEAAARHRIAAHLQDGAVGSSARSSRLAVADLLRPHRDGGLRVATEIAPRRRGTQVVVERCPGRTSQSGSSSSSTNRSFQATSCACLSNTETPCVRWSSVDCSRIDFSASSCSRRRCFVQLDFGDIGVDADDAAVPGLAFADLQPSAAGEMNDHRIGGIAVAIEAVAQPFVRIAIDVDESRSRPSSGRAPGRRRPAAPPRGCRCRPTRTPGTWCCRAQPVVASKCTKPSEMLSTASIRRVCAVSVCSLAMAEFAVALLQFAKRRFQAPRAFADLVLENDRRLEQRIGVALEVDAALDLVHQDLDDLLQLPLSCDRMCGRGSRPSSGPSRLATMLRFATPMPMAAPVKVWLTCIAWNCSPNVLKPMTLLAANSRPASSFSCLLSSSSARRMQSQPMTSCGGPISTLISSNSVVDALQEIRALGDGQHDSLVDRAEEAQAFVLVHLLDRARVVAAAHLHHDRVGRKDHRRQLVDVQADQPGVLAAGRLGVDLGDDAGRPDRPRSPPSWCPN